MSEENNNQNLNDNPALKDQLINLDNQRNNNGENNAPLGVVQTEQNKKAVLDAENMNASEQIGYRAFNLKALPSEGKFYPQDCAMSFRACNTNEIKFFSSMVDPEQDGGVDLQSKIGYILTNCIKLSWGGQPKSASDYLKEADKVCMMFAIRDLTMTAQGKENKLMNKAECGYCGKEHKYELTNNIFSYYKFPESMNKFYDENERCFVINHSSLEEPVRFYIPSVGVTNNITRYMRDKEIEKKQGTGSGFYNVRHLTMLSFIVREHTEITPQRLAGISREVESWPDAKFTLINTVIDKITFNIKPTVTILCKKSEGGCDHDVVTPIIFRKGWRHLYDISNIADELFSDSE